MHLKINIRNKHKYSFINIFCYKRHIDLKATVVFCFFIVLILCDVFQLHGMCQLHAFQLHDMCQFNFFIFII
eukprot:UN08312